MSKWSIMIGACVLLLCAAVGLYAQRGGGDGPQERKHMKRGGWGERQGMGPRKLSKQEEAEMMSALKKHRPELHQRLVRLRDHHPRGYYRSLWRAWRMYLRWRAMGPKAREAVADQERARLEIYRLVGALRRTPQGPARQRLVQEIRKAVTERFEAEQTLREQKLADLEREIKRIREELKDRAKQRDKIIAQHLQRLLRSTSRPAP